MACHMHIIGRWFCHGRSCMGTARTAWEKLMPQRNFCSMSSTNPPVEATEQPDFTAIYRFPFIVHARAINKLKVYQTVVSIGALPPMAGMTYFDYLSADTFTAASAAGIVACTMLYIMGEFFRKLIGLVYVNQKNDTVKLSHLTFWGGREDFIVSKGDIVPFSETAGTPSDVYWKVGRYTSPQVLYIIVRYGGIKDQKAFSDVFGTFE